MATSADELRQAKKAARELLDQLCGEACVFEVKPRKGEWEVRVECVVDEGWQQSALAIDKKLLLACARDEGARARVLADWSQHLAACRLVKKRASTEDGGC